MKKAEEAAARVSFYILVLLVLAIIACIAITIFIDPHFNLLGWSSVVGTMAIVFLTRCYVVTTSNQLLIMQNQLLELKKGRELIAQPLPLFSIKESKIVKPRFYYSPPEDKYSWAPMYRIKYSIKNSANYPCTNVCLHASLAYDLAGQRFELPHMPVYFEVLEEKSQTDDQLLVFHEDLSPSLLESLLLSDKRKSKPRLKIKILYKNLLGACFVCEHLYELHLGHFKSIGIDKLNAKHEIISNWIKYIDTFKELFKNEITYISTLTPWQTPEWKSTFDKINENYQTRLKGDDQTLEHISLSSVYSFDVLTEDEYRKELAAQDIRI